MQMKEKSTFTTCWCFSVKFRDWTALIYTQSIIRPYLTIEFMSPKRMMGFWHGFVVGLNRNELAPLPRRIMEKKKTSLNCQRIQSENWRKLDYNVCMWALVPQLKHSVHHLWQVWILWKKTDCFWWQVCCNVSGNL